VVVASHGNDEERVLTAALTAGVPYVALVASHSRGEAVRDSLDIARELAAQLHTPAGVDIGADTPAEIAISILAELIVTQHAEPVAISPVDDHVAQSDEHRTGSEAVKGEFEPGMHNARNDKADAPAAAAQPFSGKDLTPRLPIVDRLAALESETAGESAPMADGELPDGIEIAIDPVCGMKVAVTESTLHLDVAGRRVYFCGNGCRLAYAAPQAPDAGKR
jgi:xanthine dehydrogenase accessory factor